MPDSRVDMLISFLDYLNSIDRELSSLLMANRRHLARADARVADTFAQLASGEGDGPKYVRENGSFFERRNLRP